MSFDLKKDETRGWKESRKKGEAEGIAARASKSLLRGWIGELEG